jgi:hypothetical protein
VKSPWKMEKWTIHDNSICQLSYTFLGLGYFIPTFEGKHIEVVDAEDIKRERCSKYFRVWRLFYMSNWYVI